jgi:hypothetical protein
MLPIGNEATNFGGELERKGLLPLTHYLDTG